MEGRCHAAGWGDAPRMPEGNKIMSDFSWDTRNGLLEGNHYSYFKNYSFFHQIQFYNPAYSLYPADFVKTAKLAPWTSEASIWRHIRFPEVAIYNENSKRRLSVKPLLLKTLFLHLYLCKMLLFVAIIAKSGQKWRFWRMWHFGAAG